MWAFVFTYLCQFHFVYLFHICHRGTDTAHRTASLIIWCVCFTFGSHFGSFVFQTHLCISELRFKSICDFGHFGYFTKLFIIRDWQGVTKMHQIRMIYTDLFWSSLILLFGEFYVRIGWKKVVLTMVHISFSTQQ